MLMPAVLAAVAEALLVAAEAEALLAAEVVAQ